MSRIVVVGAGVIGLATGLMLADKGFGVTVLERDGEPLPGSTVDAWGRWNRRGVAQFRQFHFLQPRGFQLLTERLPGVAAALGEYGSVFDTLSLMPPTVADRAPREGDGRFRTLVFRRPVLEHALALIAQTRLDVRRGVTVAGLTTGSPAAHGVPHVTGVRLASGETLSADLVIDATGRRSALPSWLEDLAVPPPPEDVEDVSFSYYTRFFRSRDGDLPLLPGAGLVTHFDCFSLLTVPGDDDTWAVSVYGSPRDPVLKELRRPEKWTALVSACPWQRPLLGGDALTDVLPFAGVTDQWRHTHADGRPVVTGLLPVGDSAFSTNPALRRGMTLGLMQAAGLADLVARHSDAPATLVGEHDRMMRARLLPWYRDTVTADRARYGQLEAMLDARRGVPGLAATDEDDAGVRSRFRVGAGRRTRVSPRTVLATAMYYDADAFRVSAELSGMISVPSEIFARPGLAGHLESVAEGRPRLRAPGPSRAELVDLLR